eukprot:COSAG04_NODE_9969_length_816_cov_0.934449_1_plen_236_part_10
MQENGVSWVGRPFREDYPQLWDDYRKRIAMPMDLRTVRENLLAGIYLPKAGEKVPPDFVRDVRRIWTNAMQYNGQGNVYYEAAKKHLKWFDDKVASVRQKSAARAASASPDNKEPAKVEPVKVKAVKTEPGQEAARAGQKRTRPDDAGESVERKPKRPAQAVGAGGGGAAGDGGGASGGGNVPPYTEERRLLELLKKQANYGLQRSVAELYPDVWPKYKQMIKKPMDLGTIGEKLD